MVVGDFFVHLPPNFGDKMEVLVALHGMGGQGSEFCQALLARADRERWVVVAPTFAYGNWQDPNEVTREESSRFIPRLHEFLDGLPAMTGLPLQPKVVFFGFSRGAQLAERYAMVYPEQTLGVAAMSAGTYMLPYAQVPVNGQNVALRYPFGTADLQERFGRPFDLAAFQKVSFWVGVGDNDRNPGDVPHQWDSYIGNNRVARAETFYEWLLDSGMNVRLNVFPGVGHAVTEPISASALDFFASLNQ
jgi:predicted esterase